MSQNLLGVRPITPGYKHFEVSPQLTESLTQVSGVVPTVLGEFTVAMDLADKIATVIVPEGVVHGCLAIPLLGRQVLQSLRHVKNGIDLGVVDLGAHFCAGHTRHGRVRAHWLDFEPDLTGTHVFKWELVNATKEARATPAYPPPQYVAKFLGFDNLTSGNWTQKFGQRGFELFDWCGSGDAASTCAIQPENTVRCVNVLLYHFQPPLRADARCCHVKGWAGTVRCWIENNFCRVCRLRQAER